MILSAARAFANVAFGILTASVALVETRIRLERDPARCRNPCVAVAERIDIFRPSDHDGISIELDELRSWKPRLDFIAALGSNGIKFRIAVVVGDGCGSHGGTMTTKFLLVKKNLRIQEKSLSDVESGKRNLCRPLFDLPAEMSRAELFSARDPFKLLMPFRRPLRAVVNPA